MVVRLLLQAQDERSELRERVTELQNQNALLRKTVERGYQLVAGGRLAEVETLLIWTLEQIDGGG